MWLRGDMLLSELHSGLCGSAVDGEFSVSGLTVLVNICNRNIHGAGDEIS